IYEKKVKTAIIYISFYRIRLYKKTINFSDQSNIKKWNILFNEKEDVQTLTHLRQELQSFLKGIKGATSLTKSLLNSSMCNKLTWNTYIGTGEASTAGIVASTLWIIKGTF